MSKFNKEHLSFGAIGAIGAIGATAPINNLETSQTFFRLPSSSLKTIINAHNYCPNENGTKVTLTFTVGEVRPMLEELLGEPITPKFIAEFKQSIRDLELPPSDKGVAMYMMLFLSEIYGISSSRLCNPFITPSLVNFTDTTQFTFTFYITDHSDPELNFYVSGRKSELINDSLDHKCIADRIIFELTSVPFPDFFKQSLNKPRDLGLCNESSNKTIGEQEKISKETFVSKLYEYITGTTAEVPNASVNNPPSTENSNEEPQKNTSFQIGFIVIIVILALIIGVFLYINKDIYKTNTGSVVNSKPSGGIFNVGD